MVIVTVPAKFDSRVSLFRIALALSCSLFTPVATICSVDTGLSHSLALSPQNYCLLCVNNRAGLIKRQGVRRRYVRVSMSVCVRCVHMIGRERKN